MSKHYIVEMIRDKTIVGKCKIEIDNDTVWLKGVTIYKKFRRLGYSRYLVRKYRLNKKNRLRSIQNFRRETYYAGNGWQLNLRTYHSYQ